MIRFVKHSDIDPQRWDHAVKNAANNSVFGSYALLDILSGDQNWNALVEDNYASVMPLPYRTKFGVSYIYPPFFCPQMGIFSKKTTDAQKTLLFFNAIPKKFLQVDLLLNPHNNADLLPEHRLPCVSHQLDLNIPYDSLYANFSQNTRRNIKSAEKHFLTLEKNDGLIENIIDLFQNNRGKDAAVHFGTPDYLVLQKAAEFLLQKGKLEVLGVRDASYNLIAGAFMVLDGQRTWFWFSGRDERAAESKPMFFLLNEYIKQNCESPLLLDFNGSNNKNVARLYQGFGGVPYSMVMLQHSRLKILDYLKSKR